MLMQIMGCRDYGAQQLEVSGAGGSMDEKEEHWTIAAVAVAV